MMMFLVSEDHFHSLSFLSIVLLLFSLIIFHLLYYQLSLKTQNHLMNMKILMSRPYYRVKPLLPLQFPTTLKLAVSYNARYETNKIFKDNTTLFH